MIELLAATILFATESYELEFEGKQIKLSGTVGITKTIKTSAPAILMLPGSGPTDRDGNQPGLTTNVLKNLSSDLNSAGFITFRFDKRPIARYASQWPKETTQISEFFSMPNHLADVEAAYKAMLAQPGVDAKNCFILGHSEGGMFTLALAHSLKPKGILLLGTPGRKMEPILREQLAAGFATIKDQSVKAKLTADLDLALAELTKAPSVPSGLHPSLAALFNPTTGHIWNGYLNFDPIAAAKSYAGPALIINGAADIQISSQHDAPALKAAFGDRATLKIIPNASHNFKVPNDQDPMAALLGPTVPDLARSITNWLKAQTS
jgi:pimeloyl-ACP methyl ester carboxylesterase